MVRILAFDAGITHVGMVEACADGDGWAGLRIVAARCVDLSDIRHERVPRCACKLHHSRSLADRFAHFAQEFEPQLCGADHILVEQQPPGSAGQTFEQLLLYSHRDKTTTVHPRSVHAHHGYGHLDYDGRKTQAERIAAPWLHACDTAAASRQHDIADAVCVLLYEEHRRRLAAPPRLPEGVAAMLQSFAFTGPLPKRVGGRFTKS